jgi:hypothetical protein
LTQEEFLKRIEQLEEQNRKLNEAVIYFATELEAMIEQDRRNLAALNWAIGGTLPAGNKYHKLNEWGF